MDLDINVKNVKYSTAKKIICVMLSFVTMLIAVKIGVDSFVGYAYFNEEKQSLPSSFTEVDEFEGNLIIDVATATDIVESKIRNNKKLGFFESKRDKAIDYVSKELTVIIKKFVNDYGYDDIDAANDELDGKFVSYELSKDYDFTFTVSALNLFEEFYANDNFLIDESSIRAYVEDEYENIRCNTYEEIGYLNCSSLNIYAEKDGVNTSDRVYMKDGNGIVTESDAKSHDIYFIYNNGKMDMAGISEQVLDRIGGYLNSPHLDVLIFYFDFSSYDNGNIINKIEHIDSYAAIRNYFDTAKASYERMDLNIFIVVVMMIASFALGISYLVVAGKKNDKEKAKLTFIDYLPLELHLAISIGLGVAAITGIISLSERMITISGILVIIVCLIVSIIWWLIMELSASLARSIRSDRKLYKLFLTYWVIVGIIKLNKLIIRRIKKRSRQIINLFKYRPKAIKRRTLAIIAGYFGINGIIVLLEMIALSERYYYDNNFWIVMLVLVMLAFNATAIVFALKYLRKLDDVTYHMIEHIDYTGDKEKLTPMMRELVESTEFTNEELRNAVAKAVKDERLRTELITNVSHDLKTPLTSIINYVDLLSRCDIDNEKANQYLSVLEDKSAKLKRLIDDLIEASKVTSGNISVNLAQINLSELCLQATVEAQDEFEKAGLSLVVKPPQQIHMAIADGPKTYRIIENLLSNARKYSAKASRVYVDVYDEDKFCVFEIKNVSAQPLDISADELTERFVRGDKSRKQEGNGLGLSIAKELAKLQNGVLEIIIDGDLFKARVKLPMK